MPALGEHVELRLHAGFLQRGDEQQRVFDRHAVVGHGVPQKTGRGVGGHPLLQREEGGDLFVSGGEDGFSPAVKAEGGLKINGGKVMMTAPSGAIQTPAEQSEQPAAVVSFRKGVDAGSALALTGESEVLFSRELSADAGSVKKLQVNMANIRKKLGARPGENPYIANELGVGYRMYGE